MSLEMPSFEKIISEIDRLRKDKHHPFNQVIVLVDEQIQHIYHVEDGHEGILEIRLMPGQGITYSLSWNPKAQVSNR